MLGEFDCHSAQRSRSSGVTLYAACVAVLWNMEAGRWQTVSVYASCVKLYATASGARKAARRLADRLSLADALDYVTTRPSRVEGAI